MAETSTFENLLAYAYNECGLLECDRIQRSIDGDPLKNREFQELVNILEILNQGVPEVPDACIRAILSKA